MIARNPHSTDWTRPAFGAFTITAGADPLPETTRGIYVGASGNVTLTMESGESVQFVALAAGVVHPFACTHVTAATATGIVGLY